MACLSVSFDEILGGAAGSVEAEAAAGWLKKRPLYRLPSNLVAGDEVGLDMRVVDADFHKRRKRTSGAHLLPVLQPQAGQTTGKADVTRPAASSGPQQQQQRKPTNSAGASTYRPPAENLYSRAAFLSHGDAIGLSARRKGRPSTQFQLPVGWQAHRLLGGDVVPPSKAAGSRAQQKLPAPSGKQPGQQGASKQQDAVQQQVQQGQQFISPEGLVLPSLQHVQAVVQGPVLVPAKLVRWLKGAAADPEAAQEVAGTALGKAHLLGLLRVRVLLVKEERRQMRERLAAAAAAAAGGSSYGHKPTAQQPWQQQRRRSQRT